MEFFLLFAILYWFAMLLSGGLVQVFTGTANANIMHLFYIGLGISGVFLIMAVAYEFIALIVHNKNNTQKKE